ncbi:TPA: hypothetical protein NU587_002155 [Pseudomonas aeruginosa]|nr:hypothetical protein [Pseudomonas aeruginosa]
MDEPLFNELLESVKQADQIMTDHAELRRLAGLASGGNWYGEDSQVLVGKHAIAYCNHKVDAQFIGEANPKTILALLDEIDRLKAENDRLRQGMKGDYDIDAWLDWSKEKERIKAENESLLDELSACTEHPGGCGYWREAAKRRTEERDQFKEENEALRGALHAVQAEVDGNLRPLTRDLVNMVSGLKNGSHPNDIYEHCDEIERIIGAALEGDKP